MGERSILIEFEPEIRENLLERILIYKEVIERDIVKLKGEVINTYNSLLITYEYAIENAYEEFLTLEKLFQQVNIEKKLIPRLFHVPVCYDREFGLDLELISKQKYLAEKEIISIHSSPIYTVYFTGFLPGFLYLGGLDKRLHISRKNEPRLEVRKGAVGIGEKQTGIYPKSSPGGWQIIGNSPVQIFNKYEDPPCEISAGDKLKFFPVSKEEFYEISEVVEVGKYELKSEIYES
ncbi:allophanate hydrolase [Salinimicrobium marinum]|uniref:Allophanate hydrolase n=2 Tax=Salinimicrobium marinum TaxID=680283 RepID=A0A918S8R0_9FLAO|nr:allophanate hydrolase [Salinimicrobium marinum]